MKRFILGAFLSYLSSGQLLAEEKGERFDIPQDSLVQYDSNLEQVTSKSYFERTIAFPTQIVRLHGEIKELKKTCENVGEEIHSFFTSKIDKDRFFYSILTRCAYDPSTKLAVNFFIDAYFDPMTDEAIEYLKNYLTDHNGKDLLGIPFYVEGATGLIVSLNIDAGDAQDEYAQVLLRRQHDNKTLYFPNHYMMLRNFVVDLKKNFYTNEAEYILPFLRRWFYSHSGNVYKTVLKASNYVLLQPERIFTMSKEPYAYSSPLRMYFAHKCEKYPNKKCLP